MNEKLQEEAAREAARKAEEEEAARKAEEEEAARKKKEEEEEAARKAEEQKLLEQIRKFRKTRRNYDLASVCVMVAAGTTSCVSVFGYQSNIGVWIGIGLA